MYNITALIYSCVATEYNTLYKFVTTQRDDLCQKKKKELKHVAELFVGCTKF